MKYVKQTLALLLACVMLFSLTACGCEHEFKEATCVEPATCTLCGETEGELAAHQFAPATCTAPKTCKVCKITEGKKLEHKYADATCEDPKTCTKCKKTLGQANGHDFKAANCDTAKTCKICGLTSGKALGHNYQGGSCTEAGVCSRCKATEAATGHNFSAATCAKAAVCSKCGITDGTALGHDYQGASCTERGNCSRCGEKTNALGHDYSEATCTTPSTCTRCGNTVGSPYSHSYNSATCTAPKTCNRCGATDGAALGHKYDYDESKCDRCSEPNPNYVDPASLCSLQIPALPQLLHDYSYDDSIRRSYEITGLTYTFEKSYGDEVKLTMYFSGLKTYDYQGAGQSSTCSVGWKLYDANGNVYKTGTFYSPALAMGETFANQTDYTYVTPGAYRLEILSTN